MPNNSVDVVISNCVINLSSRKAEVFNEIFRVLKPGGRFAVSDVIADPDMTEAERKDLANWAGCIAGALTEDDFRKCPGRRRDDRRQLPGEPPGSRSRSLNDHPGQQTVDQRLRARLLGRLEHCHPEFPVTESRLAAIGAVLEADCVGACATGKR